MFEWSRPYSGGLYLALAAGMVVLIVAARRTAISNRLRSWLILVPRIGVLSALLFVLLNPVWRKEHRLPPRPAEVSFLVDASRSMALEHPLSRALQVQQAMQAAEGRLPAEGRPHVQLYRFGQLLSSAADLTRLTPSDDATRMSQALEQLPGRFPRDPPQGVVLFSDGAADDPERLSDVAADYRRMRVPIHVYPVGSGQIRGDVGIDELVVPSRAEAGTKVLLHGVVRGSGYSGERVVLEVKAAARPQLAALASLPVTLEETPQPFEMVVEANPDYGDLVLEAPVLPGEVTDQNNRVPFQLATARRKLKVIYMEGTGGDEYRWVRDALQEDQDLECLAMVADQQYVQRPRLVRVGDALRGFPATREELLQYDCVICSDISLGAFTREQLDWVVELVASRGGGFAMVGGITSFGAGKWDQTAWDQLIPIDMTGGALGQGWLYHQFQVKVPEEALQHPIWRILDDPQQNRRVIAAMPPFLGTNYMQRLKPAATALAFSATPIPQVGIMPVFAAQPYGKGRTFAFAPDTTADWGRYFESQWGEGDNRYFRRFWRNIVRWLSENSTAGNKRLRVETDRVIYRAGQPLVLTAWAYDEQLQETVNYQLAAHVKSGAETTAAGGQSLTPESSGKSYRLEMETTALALPLERLEGDSAVRPSREIEVVATHQGKEIARASVKVQILPDLHELLDPRPRHELLEQLARETDGKLLRTPQELSALLEGMPATAGDSLVSRQPLWDSPLLWLGILALLAIEWSLRRRAGYG
ncbi:MAG: glutamine amidotransferase [Planctomycetales bacterium]